MSDTLRLVADISESASTDNLSLTEEEEIEGNRKELKNNALITVTQLQLQFTAAVVSTTHLKQVIYPET